MVSRGSNPSHKLPGVASCLPSDQGIQEDLAEPNRLTANGQCYGSELHKSEGGYGVQSPVPTSNSNLDLVHREEYHSPSRGFAGPIEHSGRRGVQNSEGSLRLEAEPTGVSAYRYGIGATESGFVCFTTDKAASPILQLETGSRIRGYRRFYAEMGGHSRVCQPPMVPDTPPPR